jgi:RcsF-like lipoprotein
MHIRKSSVAVGVLSLSACAPTMNITADMRRQAAATQILTSEQVGARKYSILGEVVGRSCARQSGSDPSMDAAREELKIKAAGVSADAVANVLCKEGGIDMVHNCWKSIECRGDAIRWTS